MLARVASHCDKHHGGWLLWLQRHAAQVPGYQCAIFWSKYLYSSVAQLTDPLFVHHIKMVHGFN